MADIKVFLALLCCCIAYCKDQNIIENRLDDLPTWNYQCIPEKGCRRLMKSSRLSNDTEIYDDVDTCRTMCGHFGGLWPRPISATLSHHTAMIKPNYIRFDYEHVAVGARPILRQMQDIFMSNVMTECRGSGVADTVLPVLVYFTVATEELGLTWLTDEQYTLEVKRKEERIEVSIEATTVYGARHALETLTQLITVKKPEFTVEHACELFLMSEAKIRDSPAYRHRGFVLDTSRNFIPMVDIKRMIDGLAATKMNVFHWHVTDTHSFPMESVRIPQFTKYGAYSPSEIYTSNEVKALVEYARLRGVRVVVEIDAPAHAGNGWQWGQDYGQGDLAVCVNAQPWRGLCIQPPCGQLNPVNPSVYRMLRDLYRDIADMVSPPVLLHMGGDEVHIGCWNSSEEIRTYMANKGYDLTTDGFMSLWGRFQANALQMWDEVLSERGSISSEPVMVWSSELTQANRIQGLLDKNRYVIQVWEPVESPLLGQLMRLGYRLVSTPKNVWYLDHGFWGVTKYSNWRRMYEHRLPRDGNILGGEVAMWSEYVDVNALDARVWPRTAAVAERLWTDASTSASAAEPRLQRMRSRLIARGLRPDVLSPGWCAHNDMLCQ